MAADSPFLFQIEMLTKNLSVWLEQARISKPYAPAQNFYHEYPNFIVNNSMWYLQIF